MASVRLVRPGDRKRETTQTPGMEREEAFSDATLWSGYVETAAGMISGWHHHGDLDTVIYVLSGALRIESGPDGGKIVEGEPGDFVFVPKHTTHRESNPSDVVAALVVVRIGSGAPVINVDGPAGSG